MGKIKYTLLGNREWLYHQYITLDKTIYEIAEEVGCSVSPVYYWIKKHNIPSLGPSRNKGKKKRKKLSKIRKGKLNPFFGHKRSTEWREKMMLIWKDRVGPRNPNWKDGKSYRFYTPEFNKQLKATIRYRDGYKCQKCGCPEIENNRRLAIHHIDYDKENCEPFNLISLCKRCSSKVNSNRSYWTKYFTRKIKKIMSSSALQLHFNYTTQKKYENCNIVPISET